MGDTLCQFEREAKCSHALPLDTLERAVPLEVINAVLRDEAVTAQRERTLNMVVTVLVVLAMHLESHLALPHVLRTIAQGLRCIWPAPTSP